MCNSCTETRFPLNTPAKTKDREQYKHTPGSEKSPNKKHTCKQCKKILSETADKLLICGKCDKWNCRTCAKLTVAEYDIITKKASKVHWFCSDCDDEAMAAVRGSQLFRDFTDQTNRRLDIIEQSKANCSTVEDLCKRVEALSAQVDNLTKKSASSPPTEDMCKRVEALSAQVENLMTKSASSNPTMGNKQSNDTEKHEQAIDCLQDRIARKNNVVFFGVCEAEGSTREDKLDNNKAKIVNIANEIGVILKDEDILSFKRLGKFGQKRVVEDKEVPVPRLLLVTFTETAKILMMKNAYKLQFSSEMKEVRIKHDMSKEDRQKEYELRREARQRQTDDSNQDFLYRVRGPNWDRKIVKIKKSITAIETKASQVIDKDIENKDQ